MMWGDSSRSAPPQPRPPRPTPEDIAETLTAPDEYLWAIRRRQAWGWATLLMVLTFLAALAAVGYVGGRQAYVFSGYGTSYKHMAAAYFAAHSASGITLAQSARFVPKDWPQQLTKSLKNCWDSKACWADLTGRQWEVWRANAGNWFPELAWAIKALQAAAGGALLALLTYLMAIFEVMSWKRWEQRQRLMAGKAQRDRQRRGG
jgi:predicted PurR-regulated permease PerM